LFNFVSNSVIIKKWWLYILCRKAKCLRRY